jgi:hypothetical protein
MSSLRLPGPVAGYRGLGVGLRPHDAHCGPARAARRPAIVGAAVVAAVLLSILAPAVSIAAEPTSRSATCQLAPAQQSIPAPTGSPWYATRMGLDHIAGLSQGQGQLIAVVDTGVAPVAPLAGAVRDGLDLAASADSSAAPAGAAAPSGTASSATAAPEAEGSGSASDCDGRGTVLAGLIAARRGAAPEVRGFARAAEILPIRVVTRASDLPGPALLGSAITAAVDAGAQVVLVGAAVRDDPALSAATVAALKSGVSVVAAAGDGDDPALAFPASYDGVIAVSATDDRDAVRPVDALGRVTVGAPGVDMVGIGLDGGYVGAQQGSALAAAIVAATVADLRVTFPELTPAQLRERLAGTADRPGIAVPDAALGWGVVNPVTALTAPIGVPGTLAADSGTSTTQTGAAATGAAATGAGAVPVAGSSIPAPAVQVTLPPEPADNRWALVVAGALLILAAAAAALVVGVRRARARKWRPAGVPAPDPAPSGGAARGPAPEPVESVADQPSTDVVPAESSAATAEIPVSGTGSPN